MTPPPAGRVPADTAPPPAASERITADEFATLDGERHCRITRADELPQFLMNVPTDTDLWMFVTSAGGLTAGRRDPDGAVFPYETEDKLQDSLHQTGPITIVRWRRGGRTETWQPLAPGEPRDERVMRSLYKSVLGNRVAFEEVHHGARLAFRYSWCGSDETGWVRTVTLTNLGADPVTIDLLDGLRNILPAGAPLRLHQQSSCLVDAYKRAEVEPHSRLGIFSLTSRITDRPGPAEELRASVAWCAGLSGSRVSLSLEAVRAFMRGEPVRGDRALNGRRGNYLVTASLALRPAARAEWWIGVDTNRSHADIARLRARLAGNEDVRAWIGDRLRAATENLRGIVGQSDGLQLTGQNRDDAHHLTCVLYNDLRGGVFARGYSIPVADLAAFIHARNRAAADRYAAWLAGLPAACGVTDLYHAARAMNDPDLRRLCFEYLPLHFGRRHGDPSRPWNRFSIRLKNDDGSPALGYEGNWRDVFQNWEALTASFPCFLPGVIAKFLNASTVDGFNPYRITRDGVDWEVPDPDDPWSGIGYWGDHQIVYLLRLLESMERHFPGELADLLDQPVFSYADVPYRLAPYARILAAPRSTIAFDAARDARIAQRVAANGADGKLVHTPAGVVHHATLLEKLVVPILAKLSSLVPGGGIWMNTERPEWNDANNGLAGNGLSVVTLCHLRRHLCFVERLVSAAPTSGAAVAVEVVDWLHGVAAVLARHRDVVVSGALDDRARRQVMDELGEAFSTYRDQVYADGFTGTVALGHDEVAGLCRVAREHLDHAIRANRRDDGLYHAYNLLEIDADGRAAIRRLGPMLEGQAAALSSGLLTAAEAAELVERLFASPLYRGDRDTFLLYPDRALPGFLASNAIPPARAERVTLVRELIDAGEGSVVVRDADGVLRFDASLSCADDVARALDRLAVRDERWADAVARDRRAIVDLFVDVFGHRTYTGRSGRMFAYEGLGCVYWHMVAKLLLAVQEIALAARDQGAEPAVCTRLIRGYRRIRGGLGVAKSAHDYGAFPTDPYSHTPAHGGARQPGMTGQVKEMILARFGELGVRVRAGLVEFGPMLLRREDLLGAPGTYRYLDVTGAARSLDVPAGALAFSYCQVPVLYVATERQPATRVIAADGTVTSGPGGRLTAGESRAVLERLGTIARIEVEIPTACLAS